MVSLLPPSTKTSSNSAKSKTSSTRSSSSTDHRHTQQEQQQPVPSSPTKKIKLNHLPDFSNQSTEMLLKNSKPTLPDSIAITKKRLKPKKPTKNTSSGGARQTPAKRAYSRRLFSFLIQVAICYLGLAYFYFCPKDPSSSPTVCRSLAEVHWTLEPHLSPYLDQLDQQIRQPLQKRVDRKLRPLYEHYLLPTWTHLQPPLSATLRLSHQLVRQSGLLEQTRNLQSSYWTPLVLHVSQRYEQKLQPHVRLVLHQSNQVYTTLRTSRLIRTIKTYLPHLHSFLTTNLIDPLRHTILPKSIDLYNQHLRPLLHRLALKAYTYLFIEDSNLLKDHLKKLKVFYRHKLLRPLKKLHLVYVQPQITKIFLKLNEYQSRKTAEPSNATNPIQSKTHNDHPPSTPDPPSSHSGESIIDQVGVQSDLPLSQDDHDTLLTPDHLIQTSEPTIGTLKEWPDLPVTEPDTIADEFSHQNEPDLEEQEDKESTPTPHASPQDSSHPQPLSTDSQIVGEPLVETDNLTVDVDEFMNEIDEEIASEGGDLEENDSSEEEEEAAPKSRYTAEEVATERARLERLMDDGFAGLEALKLSQTRALIAAINRKRGPENLAKHAEIVEKERTGVLETERQKVASRLRKWFDKAHVLETVSADETASKARLIIAKSKAKFFAKLVAPHLAEIDHFFNTQYTLETEILDTFWDPVAIFSANFQEELGFGLTWLADVTHRDWTRYNQIRTETKQIKANMYSILNGTATHSPSASQSAEEESGAEEASALGTPAFAEFFGALKRVRGEVEAVYRMFEADLDGLLERFLGALSGPHPPLQPAHVPPPQHHQHHEEHQPEQLVETPTRDEL